MLKKIIEEKETSDLFKQLKIAYKEHNSEKVISLTKEILNTDKTISNSFKEADNKFTYNKILIDIKRDIEIYIF
ncbi:MAG: hypothetical protein KGD63_07555 [Candidatus Lokiarchaeota archaeon]|nr:hypothetical protein [Candidatus Lokiarchaeota archaeon]